MNLLDFLAKYPRLLKHPQLKIDAEEGLFIHELCHFVEREISKAFLPNFGFTENFGEDLIKEDEKYFSSFLEREMRVIALENFVPFIRDKSAMNVSFSTRTLSDIGKKYSFHKFYDYKDDLFKKYNREVWLNMFEEKYALL